MRINDLNAMLEVMRRQAIEQRGAEGDDLYMRTLELAQIQTEDYFAAVVSDDLSAILNGIREAHRRDPTTADEDTVAAEMGRTLRQAEMLILRRAPSAVSYARGA